MDASPGAPLLLDTIDRLLARERRRRRDASLRRALIATTLAVVIVALWRVGDRIYAREPIPVKYAAYLVAVVFVVGVVMTVRRSAGGNAVSMAREIDRRLGLADRASSALAIVRGGTDSRLASFVLQDAETAIGDAAPRIDAHFPVAARRRRLLTVRRLGIAALIAIALALLAELLTVGGPFKWLPGASPDETRDPVDDPEHEKPGPGGGDEKGKGPDRPEPKPEPEDEPKPADAKGDVRVTLRMAKEEYGPDEPVAATVNAAGTAPLPGASSFDVRISVDDEEIDAGASVDIDPTRPGGTSADLDISKIPGLDLAPGEHVARARLTTRTDREEHVSPPVKFRMRERDKNQGDDDQKKPPPPKPEPKPNPQDQPKPQAQPPEQKGGEQKPPPPPPPPPQLDRKVVMPLFGEGELVKKKGPVLVLDPGGGTEAPPERRPIAEALPEAKKRAESAVDQARLSEADRELIRRYFELLEALRK